MNVSAPFIVRPIATTLLMIGLTLLGLVTYFVLPIAGVPQVDVPTIRVSANLPGAETMATVGGDAARRPIVLDCRGDFDQFRKLARGHADPGGI